MEYRRYWFGSTRGCSDQQRKAARARRGIESNEAVKHDFPETVIYEDDSLRGATLRQTLSTGTGELQPGDEIVVPFGSSGPWVLASRGDHHGFLDDAVVPGIMLGRPQTL